MAAPMQRALRGGAVRWRWALGPRWLSASAAPRWRLVGALCLQRPPRVTPALSPVQEEMAEMMQQIEVEKSNFSDHELRHLAEEEHLQKKKDHTYDEVDSRQAILLVQDLEDAWEQKCQQFKAGPRITDADKCNDQTSLNRKLDRNLMLLVKEKVGSQELWLLPQAEWQAGETLRSTAERALAALSGNCIQAKFLGNAPCGFYKYKFPRALRTEGSVGAKVFFFKALLQSGNLLQTERRDDYMWVSKQELGDYLKPEYLKQVNRFFMDQ